MPGSLLPFRFLKNAIARIGHGRHHNLPSALDAVRFVVLDTECTGLDPKKDRILSIGAIPLQNGRFRVREVLELYLRQTYFDSRSVPIHGILPDGPHKRIPEKEALSMLLETLDNSIVVGHHTGFDLAVINQALSRHGLPKMKNPCLDTSRLYRKAMVQSPVNKPKEMYSLDELAQKFDLSRKDRHTALGDAYITAIIFMRILELLQKHRDLSTQELLRLNR